MSCKYCGQIIPTPEYDVYTCEKCEHKAHMKCLDSPKPSNFKGDFLFAYICRGCSFERKDVLTRLRLNWAQTVHFALYNLTVLESGRQGYFRMKEEVCAYIERHWSTVIPDRIKSSTWHSTVSCTLSTYTPRLFKSGQQLFNETGWWGLQEIIPPFVDVDQYKHYKNNGPTTTNIPDSKYELLNDNEYGRGKRQRKERRTNSSENTNEKPLHNTKVSNTRGSKQSLVNMEGCKVEKIPKLKIKIESGGTASPVNLSPVQTPVESPQQMVVDEVIVKTEPMDYEDSWQNSESSMDMKSLDLPDALAMNNMLNPSGRVRLSSDSVDDPFPFFDEALNGIATELTDEQYTSTKTTDHMYSTSALSGGLVGSKPASPQDSTNDVIFQTENAKENIVPLTVKEELEFLQKINSCTNVLMCDSSVRRLRRKLLNRKAKRELNLPVFSLDKTVRSLLHKTSPDSLKFMFEEKTTEPKSTTSMASFKSNDLSYHHPALRGVSVLDRFFRLQNTLTTFVPSKSSFLRLIGCASEEYNERPITSPYTSRVLKPFIRRDFQTLPPKLKVLNDIRKRNPQANPRQWPLDYCYVQPKHIAAINALCNEFFWPGIDLTECLQYPDFSCVVLYRKLLIGFAFMVPDVNYNEAYISFILVHPDWQRAGIATAMIYHLIQTCMGKDITLHVAPTNPSIMLYQRFGFKAESLILDFYDKYLPADSKGSKHAFLLRLQR